MKNLINGISVFFFAFSLYRVYIENNEDSNTLLEKGELLTKLVSQTDLSKGDRFCVYTISIMKIMDFFYNKNDYVQLLYWTSKINPEYLSSDSFKGIYPSKKEKWYLYKSKALLELVNLKKQ